MASQNSLLFLVAFFVTFIISSQGATLDVGDDDGWTLNPAESYTAWSGRLRFLVNDTLHFRYNDATDSVLLVDKDDYDNCNVDSPIQTLDGGDTNFRLVDPGAHYFITGNKSNCDQGQKLDVEVLHIRTQSPPSPPPAPTPVPTATPPSTTPVMITPPAAAPTGGSVPAPVGSNPADVSPPPPSPAPSVTPSSATMVGSGTIIASFVTMIIALCLII